MDLSEIMLRVKQFIDSRIQLDKTMPVLIGLSGGADSVALSDILVTLGYRCIACHCNFQLRGDEAERDMVFARDMAQTLNIPFRSVRFPKRKRPIHVGLSFFPQSILFHSFR